MNNMNRRFASLVFIAALAWGARWPGGVGWMKKPSSSGRKGSVMSVMRVPALNQVEKMSVSLTSPLA